MSDDLRAQIYSNLISRETEDLLDIWQNGDTTEWEEAAFEIIREILIARLGYLPTPSIGRQVLQTLAVVEKHLDSGELDLALRECELAIQMKPNLAIAYNTRGLIYDEMGQLENAITSYQKAVQLDPELKEAWGNLLDLEAELEAEFQGSPARQHLDQALEYADSGEPEKAWEECEAARTSLPSIAAAYNTLGMILQTLGRLEPAIDAYLKAIELNPRFYAARENLANARVRWEEEHYILFAAGPAAETQAAGPEAAGAEPDGSQMPEILENGVSTPTPTPTPLPLPQWLYMDRSAFFLPGWPGHRTREGRSGYDPLDRDFELAHMEGVILRSMLLGKFRTHNTFYLLMMTFLGLLLCLPLLGVMELFQGNLIPFMLVIIYSPYWIAGILLLVNVFLSLVSEEPGEPDDNGQTFF